MDRQTIQLLAWVTYRHVHHRPLGRGALERPTEPQSRLALRVEQLAVHQHLARHGPIGHGVLPRQVGRDALRQGRRGAGQSVGHGGGQRRERGAEGEPAAAGLPGEAVDPQFEYAEIPYDGNQDPGADIPGIDP